jgi:hypothetical protein
MSEKLKQAHEAHQKLVDRLASPHEREALGIALVAVHEASETLLVGTREEPELLGRAVEIRLARVRAELQQAGNQRIRPLQGGTLITNQRDGAMGTLGLVVHAVIGQTGLLTAGHVVSAPPDPVGQPTGAPGDLVGGVLANGLIGPGDIDAAFVGIEDTVPSAPYTIWQDGGGHLTVGAVREVPQIGEECAIQGAISGFRAGSVTLINAVIQFDPTRPATRGLSLATYLGSSGDSGAPVFGRNDQGAIVLLGIHVGLVQIDQFGSFSAFSQVNAVRAVVNFLPPQLALEEAAIGARSRGAAGSASAAASRRAVRPRG